MHKFSTAATKSSGVLHRLCCTRSASSTYRTVRFRGPLSRVAQRTQVGASPRDKNLCIVRARARPSQPFNSSIIGYSAPDIQMGKPRRLPLILLRVWVSTGFILQPSFLVPLEALPHRKFHDTTEFPRLGQRSGKLDILAEPGILPPR